MATLHTTAAVLRWTARTLGLAAGGFLSVLAIAEGAPSVPRGEGEVAGTLTLVLLAAVSCAVAWFDEWRGGALTLLVGVALGARVIALGGLAAANLAAASAYAAPFVLTGAFVLAAAACDEAMGTISHGSAGHAG